MAGCAHPQTSSGRCTTCGAFVEASEQIEQGEDGWFRNRGEMPPMCAGRRVYVELRDGSRPATSWPADGRGGCNWSQTGNRADIMRFKIAN